MTQPVHIEPSRRVITLSVTIAAGQPLSSVAELRSYALKGIIMPDAWTPANITLQASGSGKDGPFRDVVDDGGTEVVITASSGRHIVLQSANADEVMGVDVIRLRSGTSVTPVNQAAARELILVLGASTK